jgi:hypothetical protein
VWVGAYTIIGRCIGGRFASREGSDALGRHIKTDRYLGKYGGELTYASRAEYIALRCDEALMIRHVLILCFFYT